MPRREQGALLREVRLRQVKKQVKAPVPPPQPVQEEDVEIDQDEEEPEAEEEGEGTKSAPIKVVAETTLLRELPKPVEERRKERGSTDGRSTGETRRRGWRRRQVENPSDEEYRHGG